MLIGFFPQNIVNMCVVYPTIGSSVLARWSVHESLSWQASKSLNVCWFILLFTWTFRVQVQVLLWRLFNGWASDSRKVCVCVYMRPLCLSLTLLISLKSVIGCVQWAVCVRDSKWKWGFVSDSGDSKQIETNGRCLLLSNKCSHSLALYWQHTHICLPAALFIFLELSVWEILVITQQSIAIHITLVYPAVCFVDPQPVSVLKLHCADCCMRNLTAKVKAISEMDDMRIGSVQPWLLVFFFLY